MDRIPKDYIQANREMNNRALGEAKRHLGSGSKLYIRGWFYVLVAFVAIKYVIPFAWSHLSAFFQ